MISRHAEIRRSFPEINQWYQVGLRDAAHLALNEDELRKFRENTVRARRFLDDSKNIRDWDYDVIKDLLKRMDDVKVREDIHAPRRGTSIIGHVLGTTEPLMGDEAYKILIDFAKKMKNMHPRIAATILDMARRSFSIPKIAKYTARGDKDALRVLARMKIKAVMRDLPRIAESFNKQLTDPELDRKKEMAKETLGTLETIRNILTERQDPGAAKAIIQEYMQNRIKSGKPVSHMITRFSKFVEDTVKSPDSEKIHELISRTDHLIETANRSILEFEEMAKRRRRVEYAMKELEKISQFSDLVTAGIDLDLKNLQNYRHWLQLKPEHVKKIEEVFDEEKMGIAELWNIHTALSDERMRKKLAKVLEMKKKFDGIKDEEIKHIIKVLAKKWPEQRDAILEAASKGNVTEFVKQMLRIQV